MTSKQYFNSLTLIWFLLMAGQIAFAAVMFLMHSSNDTGATVSSLRSAFVYIVPAIVIGGIFTGNRLYRSFVVKAREMKMLSDKLETYRSSTIVRFALYEGPSLFAIIAYLLTADILFLFYTALVLVLFIYNRPGPGRAADDLELNPTERAALNNPDSQIL